MARPQKENGHVDLANEIVEALSKIHLSSYETQVLFAIFRKTYGWHKKEDWITNSQIAEMTGIAESHVSRTIKILIIKKLVIKNGNNLGFQKDYDQWEKLPKGVTSHHKGKLPKGDIELPKGVNEVTKGGIKSIPKGVYTKETKETTTKETITKERSVFFINAWKDFKEMRKKIKKPMTIRGEELILEKLNKLAPSDLIQIEILNQSIMNSWQGVFPLKGPGGNKDSPKMTQEEALKRMEVKE